MRLIFCSDPLSPNRPDEMYAEEAEAARAAGLRYEIIGFEALLAGDLRGAVRRVAAVDAPEMALYRGWMLRPEQYARLYGALQEKGLTLVNSPDAYRHCHHLPESYEIIRAHTPQSVWLPVADTLDMEEVMRLLAPFGNRPLILKDYVKSRKHEWDEACYIPSASSRAEVERVVRCFLERQEEDLNEGLVFRAFIEFQPLGRHSKSGMPLTKEFRCFFGDGALLYTVPYWEEGDYEKVVAPTDLFAEVARRVKSRFFTMDIAQAISGDWLIVELGDGQVAGLPDHADALAFYEAIRDSTLPHSR